MITRLRHGNQTLLSRIWVHSTLSDLQEDYGGYSRLDCHEFHKTKDTFNHCFTRYQTYQIIAVTTHYVTISTMIDQRWQSLMIITGCAGQARGQAAGR